MQIEHILKKYWHKKWLRRLFYVCILFVLFLITVPTIHFQTGYSTVLYSRDSILLNARVAPDEQWRFHEQKKLSQKYITALLTYEDQYFYYHPGVNPVSIARAAGQDLRAGRIVSGGSTITMQLARLSLNNPPRSFFEKFKETLMALKTECVFSKKEILQKYAAHAPFGGNVVGIQAACWRYFQTNQQQISWAQAATLAVLPNNPALIFPGKNQELLMVKRNNLLRKLYKQNKIDSTSYSLAIQEPIPGRPQPTPQLAPEFMLRLLKAGKSGQTVYASLDYSLQKRTEQLIDRYHHLYRADKIYNAAAIVIDVQTGKVLAYVGNTNDPQSRHGTMVDIISAHRSYGSVLKPVLYMASMDAGVICPNALLPDYPINLNGFSPKNYNLNYEGVSPADKALIRSLNIPNVLLLQKYSTPRFLNTLRNLGMTTFNNSATYYGLSLILGGGESTLWELTGMYASLSRRLTSERDTSVDISCLKSGDVSEEKGLVQTFHPGSLSPVSIWTAFNVLTELYRPGDDGNWEQFQSSEKIAWKTGTSFGNRDGWAIGITSRYAVGVWVGNAGGEGRSGLTGVGFAAPIMFGIYDMLPNANWFKRPQKGWKEAFVCARSGYLASSDCPAKVSVMVPKGCLKSPECPFHHLIQLDVTGKYRVNSSCMNPSDMINKSWFVLTPPEALYYSTRHSDYRNLPPVRKDCIMLPSGKMSPMTLVYPSNNAKIYIPKEREGNRGKVIFSVAHQNPDAEIFWHADGVYLGKTIGEHKMAIQLPEGKHHFTLVDQNGNSLQFSVFFLQQDKNIQEGEN